MSLKIGTKDIFDCLDIYRQPAFDHPLLRNHTIQKVELVISSGDNWKYYGAEALMDVYNISGVKQDYINASYVKQRRKWSYGLYKRNTYISDGVYTTDYMVTRSLDSSCIGHRMDTKVKVASIYYVLAMSKLAKIDFLACMVLEPGKGPQYIALVIA
ncbi:hypothetical protein FCM35_KLT14230 [Carex littledalei]|uniref:Neprosin activation peptide domain-containing protein n=1 Tax=Carex littledalei TaxID=544730 RepID=A0A833QG23_9POAL|nr:hypothetical protein FCM35_KLT14230 [Carex littledalei]